MNGDGYADLIVGAPNDDPSGTNSGASYVVFGSSASSTVELSAIAAGASTRGFVINGGSASDNSGYSVSAAGDVNGDGLADLIVGAPYADGTKGRSYVVFGKTDAGVINLSNVVNGTGGFAIINTIFGGDRSG